MGNWEILRRIILKDSVLGISAIASETLLVSLRKAVMLCDTAQYSGISTCPAIVLADGRLVTVQGRLVNIHEGSWHFPRAIAVTLPCDVQILILSCSCATTECVSLP